MVSSKPESLPNNSTTEVPDHTIVFENDDTSDHEDDDDVEPIKEVNTSTTSTAATAISSGCSFVVPDWSVVEKPINDSSSEFSDADYQVDLLVLEDGSPENNKRNSITSASICKSSICSSDDDSSCSDFQEDNELLVSNLEKANDNDEGIIVDVVIENPPIDDEGSDFEDEEEEEEEDSPLLDEDNVVVDEDDCIVVHEDDIPKTAMTKDKYLGLPMRQRPHLITNNNRRIRSSAEGRARS